MSVKSRVLRFLRMGVLNSCLDISKGGDMRGYYAFTKITDFGPYVTKLILPVGQEVAEEAVAADKFSVYVERVDENGQVLMVAQDFFTPDIKHPSKGYVGIRQAYPSDLQGNKLASGSAITLEMDYGPIYPLSSLIRIYDDGGHECFARNCYRITQTGAIATGGDDLAGLYYDYEIENYMPDVAGFVDSCSSYAPGPMRYGYFTPQTTGGKKPLIVWLHGAGEGGRETRTAYAGNKVVNLASEKIQAYFGGAYILAPQCDTYWMNDGSGTISESGNSIYVEALKACIDEFVAKNPGVDPDRIYIGGDSNGGFMTMRMIIDYPDFFAAAFPICEALLDEKVSDEDIEKLKGQNIWFTHAANDPLVQIDRFMLNTYKRLIAAGAENVHLTLWDNVVDIHEGFKDENGNPYEYFGHFSWIPMLNDDCRLDYDKKPVLVDGEEVTLLQWMAKQHK